MATSSTSFKPGNLAAVKHGARSPRLTLAKSAEVKTELLALVADFAPHLTPADRPMVEALADTQARLALLMEDLDRQGGRLTTVHGKPKPSSGLYISLQRLALQQASALGLTPTSRAALIAALGSASFAAVQRAQDAQGRLRERYKPAEGQQ